MRVSFHKREGSPELDVTFFWELVIETSTVDVVTDLFIPELFFEYLFVEQGAIAAHGPSLASPTSLPQQSLKTVFGQQLYFDFTTPLRVFGARVDLRFAESYWGSDLHNSKFIPSTWVHTETDCLESFAEQVKAYVREHRRTFDRPLLHADLSEASALADYSDRHKRRLIRNTFGVSRKEMLAIRNIHAFLGQRCVADYETPNLIDHVNSDVFYDQAHLNHMFKDRTGVSPLDYFDTTSTLQENLMATSYNATDVRLGTVSP